MEHLILCISTLLSFFFSFFDSIYSIMQDIFAASHSSFAPRAPGWQYPQHYGMGYGTMVRKIEKKKIEIYHIAIK